MAAENGHNEMWGQGDAYEAYIGRWSRLVAHEFLQWIRVQKDKRWLDVGSGSGALTQTILAEAEPQSILAIDSSEAFVTYAQSQVADPRVTFRVADAQDPGVERGVYEAVVSGLVLNFVAKPERMVSEMARACRLNGVVALYVWDYAGEMELLQHFWAAAMELDPAANELNEGFPIANARALWNLFLDANLNDVLTRSIDVPMRFANFDEYWNPFLGGQGPAPNYVKGLSDEKRTALREALRNRLPVAADGSIELQARAWAVRGKR